MKTFKVKLSSHFFQHFVKKAFAFALLLAVSQFAPQNALAASNSTSAKEKRMEDLKKDLHTLNYSPKQAKAAIYILTDLDCDFCTKLHHEIPTLNKLGVEVRVMAMPRQGVGSASYNTLVSVWCSKNPQQSFERAMSGSDIKPQTCKNPVREHFSLGNKWGIIGTPTIVFEDGTMKAGYFPAAQLAKEAIKRSSGVQKPEKSTTDHGKEPQLTTNETTLKNVNANLNSSTSVPSGDSTMKNGNTNVNTKGDTQVNTKGDTKSDRKINTKGGETK